MGEQLEIEFKTLLSSNDFSRVVDYFNIHSSQFKTHTNYYFDSVDKQLKNKNMGLRVRTFSEKAELTVKIPQQEGLLEVTDFLTLDIAQEIVTYSRFPTDGNVVAKLNDLAINLTALRLIGSLTTKRAEQTIPQGLLALDENWYNGHHDFELELEVNNFSTGRSQFLSLLDSLAIKETSASNKIQRMAQSSKKKNV